jgi:hypothetical protein
VLGDGTWARPPPNLANNNLSQCKCITAIGESLKAGLGHTPARLAPAHRKAGRPGARLAGRDPSQAILPTAPADAHVAESLGVLGGAMSCAVADAFLRGYDVGGSTGSAVTFSLKRRR